jgi:hypothetical protein
MEEALFVVEIGVEDGAAEEALECADGVSEVGGLLGLGGLADGALFWAKGDERSGRGSRGHVQQGGVRTGSHGWRLR